MTVMQALTHVAAAVAEAPKTPLPEDISENVLTLLQWVAYFATAACVAGILVTAARMAIAHRRGDDTNVASLGWVLGACVLIGGASAIVSALV
jgi:uncharacterized membrane protein YedE/YeeE